MAIGDYPKAYNPAVHGPYDPARFYGKADVPFGQVKISELGAWFGRREKSPGSIAGLTSRAFWRWQHKYVFPKKATAAPIFQFIGACSVFFYFLNYDKMEHERSRKYH